MGYFVPDRLFWAQPEDDDSDDEEARQPDQDDNDAKPAQGSALPPHDSKH